MKIFKIYIKILFLTLSVNSIAQIGIGTSSPDASAILDLSSTNKGLLIPRMTTLQQTNLINPALGLMIYNSSTGQ